MGIFRCGHAGALVLACFFSSCSPSKDVDQATPRPVDGLGDLEELYQEKLAAALVMRDEATGWLDRQGCDAMIWTGKYAASLGVYAVNVEAAEYPGLPGKFGRRPAPWCWTAEAGDQGSKTEWSRDMATAGLFPFAWVTGRRDILERHRNYGAAHGWQMGEPFADGRTLYSPQLQNLLHKLVAGLGGAGEPDSLWPDLWPRGLVDYEAHLQVMSIWLQGEAAQALQDPSGAPRQGSLDETGLRVSEVMYDRLVEHAQREPGNALYQAVLGLYSGDLQGALDLLVDPTWAPPSYVRCGAPAECSVAEWLFAASIIRRKLLD